MKKLMLAFAVFSLIALSAEAQTADRQKGSRTPEEMSERMAERMAETLNLSEEQKKEVYALHLEMATQRAAEMKAQNEKMQAEREAFQKKIEAILTPEQKAQWEERRKEMFEKRSHPRAGKRSFDGEKRRGGREKIDL